MADGDLLGPAAVREIAARLGVRPAKRLGQNFVIDPGTVRRIVALAGLSADDVVLEVGPGFGSLTLGLLPAARRVIAVELDGALAAELPRTVAGAAPGLAPRLEVINADAARITSLPGEPPSALVANLPYNVAVPVVLHLLGTFGALARGLVMVQAEVADRMTAAPGSRVYGVPSVKLAWFASARRAGAVPRAVFWPVPNVRLGPGGVHPAAAARRRRRTGRGLRGGRRRVLPAAQDAPGGAGALGRERGPGRADPPRGRGGPRCPRRVAHRGGFRPDSHPGQP